MSYLDSILPLREVSGPLLRLLQSLLTLVLAQTSSDRTRLLGSEIERHVLLVLVEEAQLRALVCVNDSKDLRDRLSEIMAAGNPFVSTLIPALSSAPQPWASR